MELIQIAFIALFVALAIRLVLFVAKNQKIPVLGEKDRVFSVRYPPVFRYILLVYLLFVGGFALTLVVWKAFQPLSITLLCMLGGIGVALALLVFVFQIKVCEEYIIYVSLFGIKKQIYDKDIKEAVVTRYGVTLHTALKKIRFASFVVYKEDLLWRLSENHVKITRLS